MERPEERETGVPQAPLPSFALLSESGPYRTLVEALDYGVLLYDPAATVLIHNAAAAQVLGLSAAELTGRAPLPQGWALFYEDGAPVTSADHPVRRAFKQGGRCGSWCSGSRTGTASKAGFRSPCNRSLRQRARPTQLWRR